MGYRLVRGGSTPTRLWAPVGLLGVMALMGYAFTRVVSTPLDNQDVGNWACTLGMAALVVEGLLVALCVHAIRVTTRAKAPEFAVDPAWLPNPAQLSVEQVDSISNWLVGAGQTHVALSHEWDRDPAA